MALIKHANAREMTREALVLDLADVQRQGQALFEQARRKADAILAEARAERERIAAGAADDGRREGLARGVAEGRETGAAAGREAALAEYRGRLEALAEGWGGALESFAQERGRALSQARRDILRLAAMIALKVTKRALTLDESIVALQLEAVLAVIVRPTQLVVLIHPEDRPVVESALPSLMARFPAVQHAELAEDASLERGSCVVRSRDPSGGQIDASIGTQLDRIVTALLPDAGDAAPPAGAPGQDPGSGA